MIAGDDLLKFYSKTADSIATKLIGMVPGHELWLVVRRKVVDPTELKFYFSY